MTFTKSVLLYRGNVCYVYINHLVIKELVESANTNYGVYNRNTDE